MEKSENGRTADVPTPPADAPEERDLFQRLVRGFCEACCEAVRMAEECESLRATIARLTAERDQLRAELLHAANTMDAAIIDEDWSADDFKVRVDAIRAALAPTQKEAH